MKTNWALIVMTTSFTLVLSINPLSYAFHENLGIDDKKASELYHSNPNDPAIVQWKSALQSAITGMDKCFDIETALECEDLIPTIISHCVSHPNTLLACNDSRFPTYPSILKQSQEAQKKAETEAEAEHKKAEAEHKKAEEERLESLEKEYSSKFPQYAESVIGMCFSNNNSNTTFEVASPSCETELHNLNRDCQTANSTYDYCKDERFLGYFGIVNSTVSPYGNLTGNSSSSNSTYP